MWIWLRRGRLKQPPERSNERVSAELDVADGDLAAAAIFLGVERDLLAFGQAADASPLQRGRVNKHVLAAAIGLNEAEAFLIVIKFNSAGIHNESCRIVVLDRARAKTRT